MSEPNNEKEIVVQMPPKAARLVKAGAASGKYRRETVRCDECGTVVAERWAAGAIVRHHRRRGREHVTIIEPWREKTSSPRERNKVEIRCAVGDCARIVAEWRTAGVVVIREKHHGETHVTIIEPWPPTSQQDLAADAVKPVMTPDTFIMP